MNKEGAMRWGISWFRFLLICYVGAVLISSVAFGESDRTSLAQPGAEPKKVADGFTFTEGPAADAQGDVYFTDIPNQRIWKWTSKDNSVSVYREDTGEANGLIFDAGGRMVICEMGNKRVTRDDMKGNITVLADSWNGGQPNKPNDLWIDANGGIYFSDFNMGPGTNTGGGLQVYYISPDGNTVTRATDDLVAPNGLIGTPDGKTLYVTDPGAGKTFSYQINPDASLSGKTLFCGQATDGMAMDQYGNLYFSGDTSVSIFSPDGNKIEEIAMPGRSTNLTFAGPERKILFITLGTSVYTLEMTVRGALTPLDMASGAIPSPSGMTLGGIGSE
jgi:gluconolactonase